MDADFRRFYNWPPDWGDGIAEGRFPPGMSGERFFTLCELLPFTEGTAVRGLAQYRADSKANSEQRGTEAGGRVESAPARYGGPGPGTAAPPTPTPAGGGEVVPAEVAIAHPGFAGDSYGTPPAIGVYRKRPRKRTPRSARTTRTA
ncbi:hypothetical protein [Streptomyces sp. ST2-7A]|uniref:hypothetical protein n=1 Tax=Streptomyces sp. ST2-7A TaxID=2907214 RepID=UPI001F42F5DC|nr:hypothetical protein [Streptomyces sp. ST2-7A]MCE7081164.1 hypothetical protein [Streptomyces sp. ST2-7A]